MPNNHDPLADFLRERKKSKEILLVSHAVLGYPSFAACRESIGIMAETGTDIVELQIPFSDPLADGPFFTHANEQSVRAGTTVAECFKFAREMASAHPEVAFVFMTYYNIVYRYGAQRFAADAAAAGLRGIIVPDLPPLSEWSDFLAACERHGTAAICLVSPETSEERMREFAKIARGFVYVQARAGVTGAQTSFDDDTEHYLAVCRRSFDLPLAVGFGITRREDVEYLSGRADIAICCTAAVRVYVERWAGALREFLRSLRASADTRSR